MSFILKAMNALFTNKNGKMIPNELQPLADYLGISCTGLATYLNVKITFLGATFGSFLLNPILSGVLTIFISLLSIAWIAMKIYDQYLVTKERKELKNGKL